MARTPREHCVRCDRDVDVEYQHSAAMRRGWRAYFIVPILMTPAVPFLAGDYVVSLPLIMAYMLGIGPVLSVIRDPPTCAECGALIPTFSDRPAPRRWYQADEPAACDPLPPHPRRCRRPARPAGPPSPRP